MFGVALPLGPSRISGSTARCSGSFSAYVLGYGGLPAPRVGQRFSSPPRVLRVSRVFVVASALGRPHRRQDRLLVSHRLMRAVERTRSPRPAGALDHHDELHGRPQRANRRSRSSRRQGATVWLRLVVGGLLNRDQLPAMGLLPARSDRTCHVLPASRSSLDAAPYDVGSSISPEQSRAEQPNLLLVYTVVDAPPRLRLSSAHLLSFAGTAIPDGQLRRIMSRSPAPLVRLGIIRSTSAYPGELQQ